MTLPYLNDFNVLKLPPYSSFLSSIETYFSVMKKRVQKRLARIPQELTPITFKEEVLKELSEINDELDGKKLFMAAREDLLKALDP